MKKIIVLLIVVLFAGKIGYAQNDAVSILAKDIELRVERLQDRYDIPIYYKSTRDNKDNPIYFETLELSDYADLSEYMVLFEEEIMKYPPSYFSGRNIRGIALVKTLFSKEQPAEGIYSSGMHVMFFDVLRRRENEAAQRHSIHHELYHMMSLQTPGYDPFRDDQWMSWNKRTFQYGSQDAPRGKRNPINYYAPHEVGFVTTYAMASLEEDKAEVFACLMQSSHKKLIEQWQIKDEILKRKIASIKSFVINYCPAMKDVL